MNDAKRLRAKGQFLLADLFLARDALDQNDIKSLHDLTSRAWRVTKRLFDPRKVEHFLCCLLRIAYFQKRSLTDASSETVDSFFVDALATLRRHGESVVSHNEKRTGDISFVALFQFTFMMLLHEHAADLERRGRSAAAFVEILRGRKFLDELKSYMYVEAQLNDKAKEVQSTSATLSADSVSTREVVLPSVPRFLRKDVLRRALEMEGRQEFFAILDGRDKTSDWEISSGALFRHLCPPSYQVTFDQLQSKSASLGSSLEQWSLLMRQRSNKRAGFRRWKAFAMAEKKLKVAVRFFLRRLKRTAAEALLAWHAHAKLRRRAIQEILRREALHHLSLQRWAFEVLRDEARGRRRRNAIAKVLMERWRQRLAYSALNAWAIFTEDAIESRRRRKKLTTGLTVLLCAKALNSWRIYTDRVLEVKAMMREEMDKAIGAQQFSEPRAFPLSSANREAFVPRNIGHFSVYFGREERIRRSDLAEYVASYENEDGQRSETKSVQEMLCMPTIKDESIAFIRSPSLRIAGASRFGLVSTNSAVVSFLGTSTVVAERGVESIENRVTGPLEVGDIVKRQRMHISRFHMIEEVSLWETI